MSEKRDCEQVRGFFRHCRSNIKPKQDYLDYCLDHRRIREDVQFPFPEKRFPFRQGFMMHAEDFKAAYNMIDIPENVQGLDASVNSQGVICLRLADSIRILMTVDGGLLVQNPTFNTSIALSKSRSLSAFMHPQGCIYQDGARVELRASHPQSDKFAKIWFKGVSFSAETCPTVYLLDEAGVRTTTDYFTGIRPDSDLCVFYKDAVLGKQVIPQALTLLREAQHWMFHDLTKCWVINNVKIVQKMDGFLRISCDEGKCKIRMSPVTGSTTLTIPEVHCTASLADKHHLFVRMGERRMYYNGLDFIVRYAAHSAGFKGKDLFKIY